MLQTHACLSSPLHSKLLESWASVLLRYSYAQCGTWERAFAFLFCALSWPAPALRQFSPLLDA